MRAFHKLKTGLFLWCLLSLAPAVLGQTQALDWDEVVRRALLESHQALIAQLTRDANRVKVEREKPNARPTLDITASTAMQGSKVTFPRGDGTSAVFLPETFARLDLTLEQVLYHPGYQEAKQRYLAQREGVDWDYRRDLNSIALEVRRACISLLKAEEGINLAKAGVESAIRYAELVKSQVTAGLAKPVDVLTATSQSEEANLGLKRAENGRLLALANLNRWLNRPALNPLTIKPIPYEGSLPTTPDVAISLAMERRPEILSLKESLKAAKMGISLARLQSQPTVSVRWQVSRQTATALVPENYMATTLEVRLPFWDGGRKNLDVMEAKAQSKRLEALLEDAKQGIALEVRQAWLKALESVEALKLSMTQLEEASGLERVAETAYRVGKITAVELHEAHRKAVTAQLRLLEAQFEVVSAKAEFEQTFVENPLLSAKEPPAKRGKR